MSKIFLALTFLLSLFTLKAYAYNWPNSNLYGGMGKYNPALNEDFYANINHEWLINAKLKPGHSRTSAFDELQDIVDENLKAIMTDETLRTHDGELIRKLYSLWLNWDERNASGLADLNEQAKLITGINTLEELSEYFMSKSSFYHDALIADYGLGYDNEDSERYNLELAATPLSLNDAAEYKSLTPNGERTKKMHDGIVSYMLRRLGYDADFAAKILEGEYNFEAKIAEHMMTVEELNAPEAIEKMYNPLSIEELREKSPNFPFAEVLEAHEINSDLINLQEPEWLKAINELYVNENLDDMKAYLLAKLAASYITVTDEPAYREYQRLSRERNGITQSKPDYESAVDFVHGTLPVPVSKIYVERYIPESAKNEVRGIIESTVKFYRSMLENEEWLSPETRKKAIEKLDAMRLNVAYPDKWVDFSELVISDDVTFYDAVQAIKKFKLQKYFYDRLNTQVDHELWGNDVVVVNSYYSPSENAIKIIAGILSGDFYSPEMSYEEKLGGIGMVIGHEISHAFDTIGAQFDKTGNMSSWWTEDDYKKFQARADKLIKYFDAFEINGENYNGKLVQTESIADMAGIKAMLGIAAGIKGFDYDKFFRSYAKIWKFTQTKERLDWTLRNDVHALPFLRVNAIVQQYQEFLDTYKIGNKDKMYLAPDERVAVW